ncbi:MAG: DUF2480 family protein [Cyclobacteriaceae bacterium]
MDEIINKVAISPLVSIDLDEFIHKGAFVFFDLKNVLFEGLILREKDFRAFIKENDWSAYHDKNVGLICTADAIVPIWAYMLLASSLKDEANVVVFGNENEVEKALIDQAIEKCMDNHEFENAKVVIKGCGNVKNKEFAYTQLTNQLLPKVSSLMYGEPCSTVPVFKKRK